MSSSAPVPVSPHTVGRLAPLMALYALSGLTALAYEVLWARMLSQQFGVSIFGVVITVTAFMAGLGAGSLLGHKWRPKYLHPLQLFGALEIAIALYAWSLPLVMPALTDLLMTSTGESSLLWWYTWQGATALLMLFLPACAMGVVFPLLLRLVPGQPWAVGRLYGWNTLGAVIGALLPLWLLPYWGWTTGLRVVAVIGVLVGLSALLVARGWPASSTQNNAATAHSGIVHKDLWAYAGIGAAALMLEMGWTRLFGMLMLRTEYVMALILAVFLAGLGLGSLLARHSQTPHLWKILPILAAVWSILGLWCLPYLGLWLEAKAFSTLGAAMLAQAAMIVLFTLPVTLAFGAWLPVLAGRYPAESGAGARLYGINALGAALGTLAAGFMFIPSVGTHATIVIAALLILICGMVWTPAKPLVMAAVALVVMAIPVWHMPAVERLMPTSYAETRDVYFHEDALGITHVVETREGQRLLLTDLQRMDASTEPSAVVSQQNQVRLPLLLHREPHRVLLLGLGTGISAAATLAYPELDRTAVEVSAGVLNAAGRWFDPVNQGIMTQTRLVRDDARRYLQRGNTQYDVIIGDLFHPDLVGRSSLLSVQQFARARARLAPGGVFVQWLALNQFDPASLAVVLRSFQHVYPQACLFIDGFRLAMVGTREGQITAAASLSNLARLSTAQQALATGQEGAWTWLGRYWGEIAATPGLVQDEASPQIEFSLPRARYHGDIDVARLVEDMLGRRPSVDQAMQALNIQGSDRERFERAYLATELAQRAWLAGLRGDEQRLQQGLRLAYQANPLDRWVTLSLADRAWTSLPQARRLGLDERRLLEGILRMHPDHVEALRALWYVERAAGATAQAEALRARLAAISPLDRALWANSTE